MGGRKTVLSVRPSTFSPASSLAAIDLINIGNLAHRDIKPQDILVDRNKAVRLIDFGTSKVLNKIKEQRTATCLKLAPWILPHPKLGTTRRCTAQAICSPSGLYSVSFAWVI